MTEQRRESDTRIDEILDNQRTHLEDFHGELKAGEGAELIKEHKDMLTDITGLKRDSAIIVELVAGKPIIDKFTNQPTGEREPGIAHRVKSLEHAANGGKGVSMRTRDKLLIIGANGIIALVVAWVVTQGVPL